MAQGTGPSEAVPGGEKHGQRGLSAGSAVRAHSLARDCVGTALPSGLNPRMSGGLGGGRGGCRCGWDREQDSTAVRGDSAVSGPGKLCDEPGAQVRVHVSGPGRPTVALRGPLLPLSLFRNVGLMEKIPVTVAHQAEGGTCAVGEGRPGCGEGLLSDFPTERGGGGHCLAVPTGAPMPPVDPQARPCSACPVPPGSWRSGTASTAT